MWQRPLECCAWELGIFRSARPLGSRSPGLPVQAFLSAGLNSVHWALGTGEDLGLDRPASQGSPFMPPQDTEN